MKPSSFICPICAKNPGSHSFKQINHFKTTDTRVFYTCPAEASKYDDYDGIIFHYDKTLAQYVKSPWIWIFDAKGFSMKHVLEIRVGIGLANLIVNKYSHNLQQVQIVNSNNYVMIIYNIIKPYLPQQFQNKILFRKGPYLLNASNNTDEQKVETHPINWVAGNPGSPARPLL